MKTDHSPLVGMPTSRLPRTGTLTLQIAMLRECFCGPQ